MNLIVSFFCAIFYAFCWLYKKQESLYLIDINSNLLKFVLIILFWMLCFYGTSILLKYKNVILHTVNEYSILLYEKLTNNPFFVSSVIIGILWFPYFIAYSPGTAMWDTFAALNNIYYPIKTAHHPIFINFIMQKSIILGQVVFNNAAIGMYIYVIAQYIMCSCAIGYLISYLVHYVKNRWLTIVTILYFGMLTVWPSYSMCMVKDTGFYALFLIFNVSLIKICESNNRSVIDEYACTLSSIGLILFRNNGPHIILLIILFLLVSRIRKCFVFDLSIFKRLFIHISFAFFIGIAINAVLMHTMGYYKGGKQEMLSIPFQQTARVVKNHQGQILDEEKEAINKVLDYNTIGARYMPRKSDPVKSTYRFWIVKNEQDEINEKEALSTYFKTWIRMLFKYPRTYAEATFANIYGYFYIPYIGYEDGWFFSEPINEINNGTFTLNHFSCTQIIRDKIFALRCKLISSKITRYFYSCGLYSVILLLCFSIMYRKNRYKTVLYFFPVILIILSCIASPVNAYIRYYLPVMAVTPLFIGEAIKSSK